MAIENLLDISLWGVPLLPSEGHDGTDIILLKFLKAKDFKVSEAFEMLRKTLIWRKEFKTDGILEEKFDSQFEDSRLSYFCGTDRDGRPLLYNYVGVYKDRDLYKKTFGTEAKHETYVRWRIQVMERGLQKLSFKPGGADSIISIMDMKDSPGPRAIKELRFLGNKVIWMMNDFYPETIRRFIFLNVPLWFYAYHTITCKILDLRNRKKFIFVRPTSVAKTLTKSTAPEQLPVQYGGLRRENDDEFSPENKVLEMTVGAGAIESIQIPVHEPGVTVVWDVTVVGGDVVYREEFIPEDECSYTILIQKDKKMETCIRNSFYINEPGLILLTIDNGGFKKKKVFYRLKSKPTVPMHMLCSH
ncbi:patellin-4-like [Telopea speciosissima]|uniref:patellin-4-like n=1 Tax=Telopea speciosissima TaxID=54955 RepID=UPI001CC82321|nr:patellin-4-like [Telopea speciosissima]